MAVKAAFQMCRANRAARDRPLPVSLDNGTKRANDEAKGGKMFFIFETSPTEQLIHRTSDRANDKELPY